MAQITTNEFAAELDTDARTARKFLRSITPKEDQPGKGSRWVLEGNKREIAKMRKQFNEWSAKQAEDKAARAAKAAEEATAALEVEDDTETLDS